MPPTTLLALMLATYAIPIAFVYYKSRIDTDATAARSISSIITSKEPSTRNSSLWSSPSSGSSRTHPSSRPKCSSS